MNETLTLLELNTLVRMTIEQSLNREYWVEAELSECRESRGHCYMELIEKDTGSNTPVARAQARCWRSTWAMLQPYFERTAGQPLRAGLKVRLRVYAQFHEAYGFSWIVTDIDPTFTLGDMARRRQQIISQLRQEGIFDLQKQLQLPPFCLHIAVISSETAAGYGDFAAQLADSPFRFETTLFPAIMQGEQVEQSIIKALNEIYRVNEGLKKPPHLPFDCVVIIRGGGATADLSGFDTLPLAENVAQFPLPIITGIGHDRDESIIDMVSHLRVKTPTAAAQYLISHHEQLLLRINDGQERMVRSALSRMEVERLRLLRLTERIPPLFSLAKARHEARLEHISLQLAELMLRRLEREHNRLATLEARLQPTIGLRLTSERHRLQLLEQRAKALDPQLILNRGYSITMADGHALRTPADAPPGTLLETRLAGGTLHSRSIAAPQSHNEEAR